MAVTSTASTPRREPAGIADAAEESAVGNDQNGMPLAEIVPRVGDAADERRGVGDDDGVGAVESCLDCRLDAAGKSTSAFDKDGGAVRQDRAVRR